jgi:hypothetical protein
MNSQKTTQKTLRIIVASLLTSDLELYELRDIADGFSKKNTLGKAIGRSLGSLLNHIETAQMDKQIEPSNLSKSTPKPVLNVISIIKKRRLSKTHLYNIARDCFPEFNIGFSIEDQTVSEFVRYLYDNANKISFMKFTTLVEGGNVQNDSFLEGIMSKDRT